jgi:hypothetical protein
MYTKEGSLEDLPPSLKYPKKFPSALGGHLITLINKEEEGKYNPYSLRWGGNHRPRDSLRHTRDPTLKDFLKSGCNVSFPCLGLMIYEQFYLFIYLFIPSYIPSMGHGHYPPLLQS